VDGSLISRLQPIFPTIEWVDSLNKVSQVDYDVLVTWSGVPQGTSEHLFVLATDRIDQAPSDLRLGQIDTPAIGRTIAYFAPGSLTREFHRPDLPVDIAELVEEVIQPGVEQERVHRILKFTNSGRGFPTDASWREVECRAFLIGNDDKLVAGAFKRSDESECWALPAFVTDLAPWARAAIRHWRKLAPYRFPGEPDWLLHERWATAEETALLAESRQRQAGLDQFVKERQEQIRQVLERLRQVRDAGNESHRVLLTEQSESLVAGVHSALKDIGFVVELVDNSGRPTKVEDLRVTDPEFSGWVALAEVKGYVRGGARASDLLQIGKFQTLFAAEHRRPPDSTWYIVNHSIGEDPSVRREPLHGADAEVSAFAETAGSVIDTRVLFDLRVDVEAGVLAPSEARKILREARGRLHYIRRS